MFFYTTSFWRLMEEGPQAPGGARTITGLTGMQSTSSVSHEKHSFMNLFNQFKLFNHMKLESPPPLSIVLHAEGLGRAPSSGKLWYSQVPTSSEWVELKLFFPLFLLLVFSIAHFVLNIILRCLVSSETSVMSAFEADSRTAVKCRPTPQSSASRTLNI